MTNHGQAYLDTLAGAPAGCFENSFALVCKKLGLGEKLDRNGLILLQDASFRATVCNLALNGRGAYATTLTAAHEAIRTHLELEFMVACDALFASAGWQNLPYSQQNTVRRIFLTVLVRQENLAF
jgi:hypothetical protein